MELKANNIYLVTAVIKGDEGYGAGFDEDWEIDKTVLVQSSKDLSIFDSKRFFLENVQHYENVNSINISISDITEVILRLNTLKSEEDAFDWSQEDAESKYEIISNEIFSIEFEKLSCVETSKILQI